jgi:NAD(P)-dependent dehydrogenase (short-subunit alcohol dehydrogenase family)
MNEIRFDGKVAVITGAGRGLGRDYAIFLARRGASVVVNDLGGTPDGSGHSQAPADEVIREIKAFQGKAVASYHSVADPEEASKIIERAQKQFGGVDILINNAGILRDKTFLNMNLPDFEEVVKVHLMGAVYITKAAFPVMRKKNYGRIVMATSSAGLWGNFGQTNYSAAKMGLVGFMNSLKLEGQKYNILVNTVAPLAATRLGEGIFPEEVMNKFMKPEMVTALVAYLCSEFCTTTGDIITAGLGFFAKSQLVEGEGIRFDPSGIVTPEMVRDHFAQISDITNTQHFINTADSFLNIVKPFMADKEDLPNENKSSFSQVAQKGPDTRRPKFRGMRRT